MSVWHFGLTVGRPANTDGTVTRGSTDETRACLTLTPGSAGTLEDMSRFQMLSEIQWELIAPMLPARTGRQGRPFADVCTMLEAIIHQYRCIDPMAGPARGLRALSEKRRPGTGAWPKRAPGTRCLNH